MKKFFIIALVAMLVLSLSVSVLGNGKRKRSNGKYTLQNVQVTNYKSSQPNGISRRKRQQRLGNFEIQDRHKNKAR